LLPQVLVDHPFYCLIKRYEPQPMIDTVPVVRLTPGVTGFRL